MDGRLIDLPAGELLRKFGAGNHKPGSGSAAALQGLLASQLLRTVIDLTSDADRRKHYVAHLSRLAEIKVRIESHIYPALEALVQADAAQFDKVIQARRAAKIAPQDSEEKRSLKAQAQKELKPATEYPIQVAKHCRELAGFALFVFDNAFSSARGDSGVALHTAVAAMAGCVAIVDLNLQSFESDHWTAGIRSQLLAIKGSLRDFEREARDRDSVLARESEQTERFWSEVADISGVLKGSEAASDGDIERLAIRFQRVLWTYFGVYRKKEKRPPASEILDPIRSLGLLGYRVETVATLGEHVIDGVRSEVAGEIDQIAKTILISRRSRTNAIRKFTAAHELGHALLHRQTVLHRDVPLDGTRLGADATERQADRFATHFLMPRKLVEATFVDLFLGAPFRITDGTAFALIRDSSSALRTRCMDLQSLARTLASAESYDSNRFMALSATFGVSAQAMANRLIELQLVEY